MEKEREMLKCLRCGWEWLAKLQRRQAAFERMRYWRRMAWVSVDVMLRKFSAGDRAGGAIAADAAKRYLKGAQRVERILFRM